MIIFFVFPPVLGARLAVSDNPGLSIQISAWGGIGPPPIGGGPKGGDKGLMGGEWRVIRDTSMIGRYKCLKQVSK